MNATACLFLRDGADGPVTFSASDGEGADSHILAGIEELTASGLLKPGQRTGVILSGERIAARGLDLAIRNRKQLERAAGFFLEDELAGDIAGLHKVVQTGDENTPTMVAATDRDWITEILDSLQNASITPAFMTADFLCLDPVGEVVVSPDRLLFRHQGNGFAAPATEIEDVLRPVFRELETPETFRIRLLGGAEAPGWLDGDTEHLTSETMTQFLTRRVQETAPLNLLQGLVREEFALGSLIRQWRLAGGLAAACLVLAVCGAVADGMRLQKAETDLIASTEELFAEKFPERSTRNIRRQLRTMGAGQGSGDFLGLLEQVSPVLSGNEEITLTQIDFTAEGQLVLDLRFPDFTALDRLKEQLVAAGLTVDEGRNQSGTGADSYAAKLFVEASA